MSVMFDVFLGKIPHSLFTKKLDERIFFTNFVSQQHEFKSLVIKINGVDFTWITVNIKGGVQTQGKLSFRRPCFSFRLTDRSTFGKFFFWGGSQHVKYASQDRSQRARPRLVVVCNFTEIDYNYLLWEHDGKVNFPPTLITLSWLPWDTRSRLS